jgi:preprotein translocase subunit SecG
MNRTFIICAAVFTILISGMVFLSNNDKKTPISSATSREFDNWCKEWEKQR